MSAASAFNLPIACRLLSGFGERLVGIYARLVRQCFRRVFKAGLGQEANGFLFANAQEPMPSDSQEPMALGFPNCRCLHTFFIRRRLLVVFVAATGRPVQWHWSRPWGVYFCAHARHAIEIDWQALSSQEQANVKDWLFAEGPLASSRQAPNGYSLIEALLAMPVVLLMGLLVVQLGFLAQQALTVNYAVGQSVREFGAAGGSLSKGLALGLSPLLLKTTSPVGSLAAAGQVLATSQAALASARVQGWVDWQVLEPKPETFYDWGLGADQLIVPPAWVKHDLSNARPRSGSGPTSDAGAGLVSGQRSGVTRLDASRLRVRFVVGLPLNMPLAGPLLAKAVAWSRGCSSLSATQLGAVQLASQSLAIYSAQGSLQDLAHDCLLLKQGGFNATGGPRLPVRFEVKAQAQSVLDPRNF